MKRSEVHVPFNERAGPGSLKYYPRQSSIARGISDERVIEALGHEIHLYRGLPDALIPSWTIQ